MADLGSTSEQDGHWFQAGYDTDLTRMPWLDRALNSTSTVYLSSVASFAIGVFFIFVWAPHPWGWEGIDHYHDLGRLLARGLGAPRYHAVSHARLAEGEATNRVVALSQLLDVPILLVHVSAGEAKPENWLMVKSFPRYPVA